jgi:hypothetical protein
MPRGGRTDYTQGPRAPLPPMRPPRVEVGQRVRVYRRTQGRQETGVVVEIQTTGPGPGETVALAKARSSPLYWAQFYDGTQAAYIWVEDRKRLLPAEWVHER